MTASPLLACTRMYNVCESVTSCWAQLVQETERISGIPLRFEHFTFPQNIEELWMRQDLGLTLICGRSFALYGMQHIPLAAPVRLTTGTSTYHTKLLVRADSTYERLEDSFGSVLGWTVSHSHSGYMAVRKHLKPYQDQREQPLYTLLGPLHTPALCLKALADGSASVVPVDGYYYELLLRNAPEALAGTRILDMTAEYPIPFFAASPGVDPALGERLADAVQQAAALPALRPVLESLCISGFARPDAAVYLPLGGDLASN